MPAAAGSASNHILLFRFHSYPGVARERLRIIHHFNPGLRCYALFGGPLDSAAAAHAAVADLVVDFWWYNQDHAPQWRWMNGDLMVKAWYRAVGRDIDFDFLYNYEYDLLITAPLDTVFPSIDQHTVCLGGLTEFTQEMYDTWCWTTGSARMRFLQFRKDMFRLFGVRRQGHICQGPGMLFPKTFLDRYCDQEDNDLVHDELRVPAYAEALGFGLTSHPMHPGAFAPFIGEHKLFNCYNNGSPTKADVLDVLTTRTDRSSFHPVKYLITLEDLPAKHTTELGIPPNSSIPWPTREGQVAAAGNICSTADSARSGPAARRFNVTRALLKPRRPTFHDPTDSVSAALHDLGHTTISTGAPDAESIDIVFGHHEAPQRFPGTSIVYQLVPVSEYTLRMGWVQPDVLRRNIVWDYSRHNVEQLRARGVHAHYVPIGHHRCLQKVVPAPEKDVDVLFYGSGTPRRLAIVSALRRAGLRVVHIDGVYADALNAIIARAKVVLNLHMYKEYRVLESVQVGYLMSNRKAVVAEVNGYDDDDELGDGIAAVPYRQLVDTCVDLVRDETARTELESAAFSVISRRPTTGVLAEVLHTTEALIPTMHELPTCLPHRNSGGHAVEHRTASAIAGPHAREFCR
ncbi:MAG: hypothetical protein J2P17_00240 [Mycobacterium sp.]|nr:hypothetical protein [Mycobacterium sp.]